MKPSIKRGRTYRAGRNITVKYMEALIALLYDRKHRQELKDKLIEWGYWR